MQHVAAAVIRKGDKILIARRKPGRHMGNKWEFPGGKILPGESPEECLKRELAEELAIEARIGTFIGSTVYRTEDIHLELSAFWAESLSGVFILREHEELRWVFPEELESFDLADSDRAIARAITSSRA